MNVMSHHIADPLPTYIFCEPHVKYAYVYSVPHLPNCWEHILGLRVEQLLVKVLKRVQRKGSI